MKNQIKYRPHTVKNSDSDQQTINS